MSVYRRVPGGDYHVDREFSIDGQTVRVKAQLWTGRKGEALVREAMLVEIHRAGRYPLIRALKAGDVTVLDLVAAKLEHRLYQPDALREITDRRNLWDVLDACITMGTASERTKSRYRLSLRKLQRSGALGPDATLKTLPVVQWNVLRGQWGGSPADWNHLVRMLSHCLSLYYGDVYAPQRRAVMKLIPKAREPRARLRLLSLDLFRRVVARTPAEFQPIYWALLLTGMRAGDGGEYFRCTAEHLDGASFTIRVPGTKTVRSAGAIAIHPDHWPTIQAAIPAPRQYKAVARQWKRAARSIGRPTLRLHDIRHLCIGLALDGGASLPDVQAHARHEDPTMTMDYARIESSRRAALAIRDALKEITP